MVAAGALAKVTGMPLPESLGTLMVLAASGPRAKSGMLRAGLPSLVVANVHSQPKAASPGAMWQNWAG